MNRNNFLFTMFFSLAAAAVGGLLFNLNGTPIENSLIVFGLLAAILFAFLAGYMQATINLQNQRQRGIRHARQIVNQAEGKADEPR